MLIFEVNYKFEVVDKRNFFLVWVVIVVEVNEYWLWIYFDGWDDIYDDWFEVDSLDFYLVGWCEKIGYFLEIFFSKLLVIYYNICDRMLVD